MLVRVEKVVAPLDRRAERLLARVGVAGTVEEIEPLTEPVQDLGRREHVSACSRELDGERKVVESRTERGHCLVQGQARAVAEKERGCVRRQRLDRVLDLVPQPQKLTAGHEDVEVRAPRDQVRNCRAALHHLLEVVKDEQQLALADVADEIFARAERAADFLQHELLVVDRCQLDPEDARPELRHELGRRLDRQAGLAGAAGPREREQPRSVTDTCDDRRRVARAAEERARGSREVRVGDRLQRWEGPVAELVERNWLVEVLQPVLAEIEQVEPTAELTAGVSGEHDLATVAHRADPGRKVDVGPDVPLARHARRARVDADPDANRPGIEELGSLRSSGDRIVRRGKDEEERVALGVDLGAVVARERFPQGAPVIGQDVCVAVAELMEEPRRSLHVGEEEGDRAAREVAHRRAGRRAPGLGHDLDALRTGRAGRLEVDHLTQGSDRDLELVERGLARRQPLQP